MSTTLYYIVTSLSSSNNLGARINESSPEGKSETIVMGLSVSVCVSLCVRSQNSVMGGPFATKLQIMIYWVHG